MTDHLPTVNSSKIISSEEKTNLQNIQNLEFINRRLCMDALTNKEHQKYLKLEYKDKKFYKKLRNMQHTDDIQQN